MHCMLDFETLGSGTDTIVVSLGAAYFNKTGIKAEKLFLFDIHSQQMAGRSFTASTLEWWMRQKEGARDVFDKEKTPGDRLTLKDFFVQFEKVSAEALALEEEAWDQFKPWGNGANFDISILEDMYRRHHENRDQGIPWKFWNVFCFRTFNALTDCKRYLARPHGTHHSALDDARYQAECVVNFWKRAKIKKGKT